MNRSHVVLVSLLLATPAWAINPATEGTQDYFVVEGIDIPETLLQVDHEFDTITISYDGPFKHIDVIGPNGKTTRYNLLDGNITKAQGVE